MKFSKVSVKYGAIYSAWRTLKKNVLPCFMTTNFFYMKCGSYGLRVPLGSAPGVWNLSSIQFISLSNFSLLSPKMRILCPRGGFGTPRGPRDCPWGRPKAPMLSNLSNIQFKGLSISCMPNFIVVSSKMWILWPSGNLGTPRDCPWRGLEYGISPAYISLSTACMPNFSFLFPIMWISWPRVGFSDAGTP